MNLKSLIFAFALAASPIAMAQYDLESSKEQYQAEVAQSVEKMQGTGTHNAAPEPFKDFIKLFSADSDFMNSRIALSQADREKFKNLIVPETFEAKMPVILDNDGVEDVYYQVWDEMQFHTVHLDCCWDGILEHSIIFEKKNGKWYLSQILE